MTPRFFIVGTDTGIGKTAVACGLLRWAAHHNRFALPFKPAQSGDEGPHDDAHRLLAAAKLPPHALDLVCPLRYRLAVAPGIAENPDAFIGQHTASSSLPLERAASALARLEADYRPELVLIEGAGGLLVPMPGATWQPEWISQLQAKPIIVADATLGTINHTLLTIDALRSAGLAPIGFYLSDRNGADDPSRSTNAAVIAHARGIEYFGTLARTTSPDAPGSVDLFAPLLRHLG